MLANRYGPVPAARVWFPPEDLDELGEEIKEILRSGRLTLGSHTEAFETEFAALHGRRFAVAVNSGTSALEIILRALRVRDEEVIVPTNTFAATAFAVLHSANRLVLADVDQDLFLDPVDLAHRITPLTKAVIAVHIGGRIVPAIREIQEMCEAKGIALIEDAAHAHGSRLQGRLAGSFGLAAAFSFYPTKVMTSGEGGMIVTDEERLARTCRTLRDQGKAGFAQNIHTELGNNWRMSEIHAAIGRSQLRHLPRFIESRRRAAKVYDDSLMGFKALQPLREVGGMRSNYYKYVALLPATSVSRASLKSKLKQDYEISLSGEVYEMPLHQQPIFQDLAREERRFPIADDLCRRHICLPIYSTMEEDEAEFVVTSVQQALAAEVPA